VQRDAARAGDKVGDELKDGAREGERSADRLEKKFRDAFETVEDKSRTAGRKIGDNVTDGARKAERGLDELKDESNDTAREVAASFDGSAESIAEGFQEVAANALGGFGPAGAAAGLALAAGAGIFLSEWQKTTEETKALVSGMFEDMIESGNRYLSESFVQTEVKRILDESEGDYLPRIAAAAEKAGVTMGTALRAIAGDQAAAEEVMAGATEYLSTAAGSARTDVNLLTGEVDAAGRALDSAGQKAEWAAEATQATGEAARAYDQAVADLPGTVAEANKAIEDNIVALGSQEAAAGTNNGVLADLAGELDGVRQAAVDAGVAGDDLEGVQIDLARQFVAAAVAAGKTSDEAVALARRYDLIPEDVSTDVIVNGAAAAQQTARDTDRAYGGVRQEVITKILAQANTSTWQAEVDRAARSLIPPSITIKPFVQKAV